VAFGADGLAAEKYGESVFENANAIFIFPGTAGWTAFFLKVLSPSIDPPAALYLPGA
jgi:hypothetical protein